MTFKKNEIVRTKVPGLIRQKMSRLNSFKNNPSANASKFFDTDKQLSEPKNGRKNKKQKPPRKRNIEFINHVSSMPKLELKEIEEVPKYDVARVKKLIFEAKQERKEEKWLKGQISLKPMKTMKKFTSQNTSFFVDILHLREIENALDDGESY